MSRKCVRMFLLAGLKSERVEVAFALSNALRQSGSFSIDTHPDQLIEFWIAGGHGQAK